MRDADARRPIEDGQLPPPLRMSEGSDPFTWRLPVELTAVLTPAEEGGFIALNPETGTTTQGETVEEAIENLREATALYLSEFPLATKGHPLVTMFSVPEHV
jgi:predicted RNase H-like HicB family nuclease